MAWLCTILAMQTSSDLRNAPADSLSAPDKAELSEKRARLQAWMERERLDAVLLARHENIAWATGGVDVRIGVIRETGAASLLMTRDGRCFYLTANNEEQRLATEEFAGRGFEPVINPWYANDVAATVQRLLGESKVGSDMPMASMPTVSLLEVRQLLTDREVERYRWLGRNVAEQVSELLQEVQPGMREREMQSMLGQRLISLGILPSVYLTATDERALTYRHPVPREGELQRFGMIGLCARRWGLTAAITRFVHFGNIPADLDDRFAAVAQVNAALLHATKENATSDSLFTVAKDAYSSVGYANEEREHHQGGATGYTEREWIARPGGTDRVNALQAFAWNPTIQGAKVEDTNLLRNGEMELLTATPDLPQVSTQRDGREYVSTGVLLR